MIAPLSSPDHRTNPARATRLVLGTLVLASGIACSDPGDKPANPGRKDSTSLSVPNDQPRTIVEISGPDGEARITAVVEADRGACVRVEQAASILMELGCAGVIEDPASRVLVVGRARRLLGGDSDFIWGVVTVGSKVEVTTEGGTVRDGILVELDGDSSRGDLAFAAEIPADDPVRAVKLFDEDGSVLEEEKGPLLL